MHSLVKVGHDAVRNGGKAEYSIHDLSADIVACKLELIQSFSPVKQQSINKGTDPEFLTCKTTVYKQRN